MISLTNPIFHQKDNIKEIRALLEVIKERQAATRGMVDHVKGSNYNLEAVSGP